MGGTNAHVVLEEAPAEGCAIRSERSAYLLTYSAKSEAALDRVRGRLGELIGRRQVELGDASYTLALGRAELPAREAIVVRQGEDMAVALADRARAVTGRSVEDRSVVYLFPGQGAQYINMGRELYRDYPLFRVEVDRELSILWQEARLDLTPYLLSGTAKSPARHGRNCRCHHANQAKAG
jgi:acyl transferase domain-containing protein